MTGPHEAPLGRVAPDCTNVVGYHREPPFDGTLRTSPSPLKEENDFGASGWAFRTQSLLRRGAFEGEAPGDPRGQGHDGNLGVHADGGGEEAGVGDVAAREVPELSGGADDGVLGGTADARRTHQVDGE